MRNKGERAPTNDLLPVRTEEQRCLVESGHVCTLADSDVAVGECLLPLFVDYLLCLSTCDTDC